MSGFLRQTETDNMVTVPFNYDLEKHLYMSKYIIQMSSHVLRLINDPAELLWSETNVALL